MDKLFLAIDLGTSAVKALLVDHDGKEVSNSSSASSVYEPRPLQQEQDIEDVWQAMKGAVSAVMSGVEPDSLAAISFSCAMHGMMLLDKNNKPLTRMLTWADGRSSDQAAGLARDIDGSSIYRRTGCPAKALYYPARILWFREKEPRLFQNAAKFASIKDCIIECLTGRLVMDRSNASSNGLLDIHTLEWDKSLLDAVGISPGHLPELVDPDAPVGGLTKKAASELNLPAGIPVIPGGGDGGLANLGAGAVDAGQAAVTIGTSGALRKISPGPWIDPRERTWCYYLADSRWYSGGAINSGGIIIKWLQEKLFSNAEKQDHPDSPESYSNIFQMAETIKAGAEGLVFLPYLYGERTPYWNPDARGVMFGLDPRHGKAHVARAAIEGICMCIAQVFESVRDSEGGVSEIRATGGFTKSDLWLQILADVLGMDISLPRASEGSAMGAAILAMKASGAISGIEKARELVPVERIFKPNPDNHELYKERLELFKDLYARVEDRFKRHVLE